MFEKIQKRDGRVVKFDPKKIVAAIEKAGLATGEFDKNVARKMTIEVLKQADRMLGASGEEASEKKSEKVSAKIPTVEEIQDVVEDVLVKSTYSRTAKAYILYREQHKEIRDITNRFNLDLVDGYIGKLDWQVNENSNMTFSLQGLNNYIFSEINKVYWLNKIYPKEVREAHSNGDFHLHDLNLLAVYCVGWDLLDLLMEGFGGVSGKVESAPAKHFRAALGQAVNFFYTLQGEAAGAQAFSNFDTLLAPFIRYDHLEYKEVKQALQEFMFNMNVPTRVGFQTPFTNITLDLNPPKNLEKLPIVIGGKLQKEKYGEFQSEMDMFNRALLEVMLEGDAKGRVFTFPIPTYNITKDFDWDNPNLDLLWKITAKYGIPYFSNFVNSDMKPEDSRSMCCRLRLDTKMLEKRGGGLFGANPLTGSIGVVTINMARIGYLTKDENAFIKHLEKLMYIAKESLEIKRKVIEKFTEVNLYPYTKFYLRKVKEQTGKYWENHFSTIGIVGMNEACINLFGKDISHEESHDFTLKVMDYMRAKLIEFQEDTKNNYNLEATPAEGTSYRLAKIDKERHPQIIVANESEYQKGAAPFYTNSSHMPVGYTDDVFETLDAQDDLQTKYTGGTVVHIFVKEKVQDGESVKNLVKKICQNYHLPYFTLTPTFSVCPSHGYLAGEQPLCETCGAATEVYSRVVGYLRPVAQWNNGKKEEFKMRKTYVMGKTGGQQMKGEYRVDEHHVSHTQAEVESQKQTTETVVE